jgi:flagellar hook protein FlgE
MNVSSAISGLRAADRLADHAARNIAEAGVAPDADLASDVVDLVLAGVAYGANARVLQTQDEVTRTLIDVIV